MKGRCFSLRNPQEDICPFGIRRILRRRYTNDHKPPPVRKLASISDIQMLTKRNTFLSSVTTRVNGSFAISDEERRARSFLGTIAPPLWKTGIFIINKRCYSSYIGNISFSRNLLCNNRYGLISRSVMQFKGFNLVPNSVVTREINLDRSFSGFRHRMNQERIAYK